MAPAREAGCIVHMHSDGDIRTLVDDLMRVVTITSSVAHNRSWRLKLDTLTNSYLHAMIRHHLPIAEKSCAHLD
jgi:hypothetical protein